MHYELLQLALCCHYLYSEVPSFATVFVNQQTNAEHGQTPFYSITQAYHENYLANLSNYLGNLEIGDHLVYTDPPIKLFQPLHHSLDLGTTLHQIQTISHHHKVAI